MKTPQAIKAFAVKASLAIASTTGAAHAQSLTYSDVVAPYMSYLKRTYSSEAGIDIINSASEGNGAQQAFATIARGIRDGRYDVYPPQTQYRILGCHLSDLEGMAGQIADQIHPSKARSNPNLPTFKWPFIEKVREQAESGYNDFRHLGYSEDCGRMRLNTKQLIAP